MDIKVRWH